MRLFACGHVPAGVSLCATVAVAAIVSGNELIHLNAAAPDPQ
jgi:hypothetical protein